MRGTPEERYLAKILKEKNEEECWRWTASVTSAGYGKIYINGRLIPAHRFSWELHNKQVIPEGLIVRHKCDNPPCTNPNHLELGTLRDNTNDARVRGRLSNGHGETYPQPTCKHGHPWSEDNTYIVRPPSIRGDYMRVCRTCMNRRQREYAKRKREKLNVK